MADSGDFLTADEKATNMQYVNDIEYLSEWPPVEEKGKSEKLTLRKRQKVDRVEERSLCGGLESEGVLWARPALARWWRKRQSDGIHVVFKNMPKSDNPNTLLKYVASLPEGKAYLKQQIDSLKEKVASHCGNAVLYATLASYQDLLQDTSSALNSLNIATKLDPQDKNIAWLHLKVKRGKELENKRNSFLEHLLQSPSFEHKMAQPVDVGFFVMTFIMCIS